MQEECLLAAVGADGRLRGLSAEQARFCRAWRERAIAAGGSGMQIMFRAQWDAWHSKWVWAAATMEDSVGDQAGGDAGLDTHDLEVNSADDGAFAVTDHKIAIETEPQWTAAGDGGDGGYCCWPLTAAGLVAERKDDDGRDAAAEDVKALVRELMWTSAGDGGDDGWCYWPSVTGVVAAGQDDACVTGACLSIASRASLVPKNNGAETQVLQDVSLPKSRRPQVARLATACTTDNCLPLASRTCRDPKNNGEETQVLQDVSLPKSRRSQVVRLATACATDICLPLASRTCRDPKNNGEEIRGLQDVSLPESRRLQVARLATVCATDTCSPLASRTCRDPKNKMSHSRKVGGYRLPGLPPRVRRTPVRRLPVAPVATLRGLQDVSLPKSKSLQVGMPQGAHQVLCLSGLPVRRRSGACISTVRPLQVPIIAECVKGALSALTALIGACTGEAHSPDAPVSLAPECWDVAPSLQMRFDGFRGVRIGEAQNPGPAFAGPGNSAIHAPPCGDEFLLDVGDPKLSSLNAGDRFDVVIHFNGERYKALWHDEHCFAHNLMIDSPGTYTVYGAILCSDDAPTLTGDSCTRVFARPSYDGRTCWRLQELCAGLGGIAVGMQATGGCVLASVDRCALSCETLRLNESLVVQGDLQDRHVRIAAHEAQAGQSCLIAAGVPCQGYSPQGNCKGFDDPRSRTLLHVLRVWCGIRRPMALS